MLTVMDYCLNVQTKLRKHEPAGVEERVEWLVWFGDTGRAVSAVGYALEGKDSKALRLAETLADKYQIT